MADPVTSFINTTDALVDFAITKLSSSEHWTVYKLPSMIPKEQLRHAPDLKLPALVITHLSSQFQDLPRRTAVLSVVIAVDALTNNAEFEARDLCDEAIGLLDDQIYNGAHYRIKEYRALEVDPGIAAHELLFEVHDH